VRKDWITPDWPAPANVRAVCTTRAGGVSLPPYDTLNLGDHVGDEAAAVARNRGIFGAALDAHPVFLQQVHGTGVIEVQRGTADGTQADGCFTTRSAVACTIMVADCLPVLFTDTEGTAVAAAHAGWRGLAGVAGHGILESVSEAFWAVARTGRSSAASKTIAWLGPCIGPQAFEVGDEVRQAFASHDAKTQAMFRPHAPGKWLADLQGLARLRLQALGITQVHGNDGSAPWCTVSEGSRFFSHRRDRISGRFAAAAWLA
jgi:YfiH family protein